MKAQLTQRIRINQGFLEPGTVVEIEFFNKPKGSYRASHRTPYTASYQLNSRTLIRFNLSRNSFEFIEGNDNVR